ncbi:activator of basal transcription 1 isoform X2 [Clupea harengus]|nr:activator of basal transcription 1 isoform X2 [Clupea harengus]XP_031422011.1 activator of basal transcription 1 isoform X2 [Clupea harengus]XP_031422012.1 activator of basal transcription 1 isoform X2 [Clupea harengus]
MTTEHERGVVVTQDTTCEDDRMAVHNTEPLEGVGQSESAAEDHDEDQDEENGSEGSQEQDASIANSVEEEDGQDPKKKTLPGIVYIGHIPPRLRPRYLRTMLGAYGEIGRVFLNPESRLVRRKKKKTGSNASHFTEGWVEFRDKRIAKRVAVTLNNTPIGNRKKSRFAADLWAIKYLHRFNWCHLSERLAYEQTVYHQRMRTEIAQAKKETNFYLASVEKSQNLDKIRKKKEKKGEKMEEKSWDFKQRRTEVEIQMGKNKGLSKKNLQKAQEKAKVIQQKAQSNTSLLAKIFNSGRAQD